MAIRLGDNRYGKAEVRLVRVTRDGDRGRDAGKLLTAVEERQARVELMANPQHGAHGNHHQQRHGEQQEPAPHRMKITSE